VSKNNLNHCKFSPAKRIFDIVLSIKGLALLTPFWAVAWFLILLEDGFPVFIKQRRIGKNGIVFDSFKFRSMHKLSLDEHVSIQAREDDTRITKVGRFLRNTALDESPQLINILMGQMSFVGPRPLLQSEVEINGQEQQFDITKIPGYRERTSIVPGLTGLAQLYHSRDIPRKDKFQYDLEYIATRSFLLDLKLIALSILVTLLGRWEVRKPKLIWLRKSNTKK
jgi:lipopolysaccharide/colanic/teichoic acid biosynthesis glycosyltransferase